MLECNGRREPTVWKMCAIRRMLIETSCQRLRQRSRVVNHQRRHQLSHDICASRLQHAGYDVGEETLRRWTIASRAGGPIISNAKNTGAGKKLDDEGASRLGFIAGEKGRLAALQDLYQGQSQCQREPQHRPPLVT